MTLAERNMALVANPRDELIAILQDARELLAHPDNDYMWSSWRGQKEAIAEVDDLIAALGRGEVPTFTLNLIFAPTGPMQEISSGWDGDFLELGSRFDAALRQLLQNASR